MPQIVPKMPIGTLIRKTQRQEMVVSKPPNHWSEHEEPVPCTRHLVDARGAALARRLEVGVALVNNHSLTGILPETPWTGVKDTGPGVASSRHAYPTFVRRRTVVVDKNRDPDPFWLPATPELAAFAERLAEMQLGKLRAIPALLGLVKKRVQAIKKLASGS